MRSIALAIVFYALLRDDDGQPLSKSEGWTFVTVIVALIVCLIGGW